MYSTPPRTKLLVILLAFFLPLTAANAAIINIDARVNGQNNPLSLYFEAGTYSVTPIGTADGGAYDAFTAWLSTSCANVNGCAKTAPTSVTGWMNLYRISSPDLVAVSVEGTPIPLVTTYPPGFQDFFLETATTRIFQVDDGNVYPNPLSALAQARSSTFTLSTAGFVNFDISDIALSDNSGGISLSVNAVPLPPAIWLFASAIFGLIGIRGNRNPQ